jgi:hypothetical protein
LIKLLQFKTLNSGIRRWRMLLCLHRLKSFLINTIYCLQMKDLFCLSFFYQIKWNQDFK